MKYSILIIDDSEEDRFLLKRYLRKSGLDVAVAEAVNGEQALHFLIEFEKYQQDHSEIKAPLVVFLDVNMPIMNGWEFLEEFSAQRDQIPISPIVVIIYSTSDQEVDKARATQFECVKTYVVKGNYTPDELKRTIVACVQPDNL